MIPAKFTIAVGGSRKAKQWKNKEFSWPDILDKLRVTTRTRESAAEYANLSKPRQDEIKDVGGFVGGYIKMAAALPAMLSSGSWSHWTQILRTAAL